MNDVSADRRTTSGNSQADWTALYDTYSPRIWRYVARIIGSDADAVGDAVQETFLAAARSFHRFDSSRGTLWAWLSGIAHKQAALYWRRVGRERITAGEAAIAEVSSEDDVVANLAKVELVAEVRRVLADMSPESASLLQGKYCDGESVAVLVERFGGTTESVRSKLARARRDFRQRFEQATGEGASRPIETNGG